MRILTIPFPFVWFSFMKYLPLINDHHFMTITTLTIGYVIVWIEIIIKFRNLQV